jgi:hypothetical protein
MPAEKARPTAAYYSQSNTISRAALNSLTESTSSLAGVSRAHNQSLTGPPRKVRMARTQKSVELLFMGKGTAVSSDCKPVNDIGGGVGGSGGVRLAPQNCNPRGNLGLAEVNLRRTASKVDPKSLPPSAEMVEAVVTVAVAVRMRAMRNKHADDAAAPPPPPPALVFLLLPVFLLLRHMSSSRPAPPLRRGGAGTRIGALAGIESGQVCCAGWESGGSLLLALLEKLLVSTVHTVPYPYRTGTRILESCFLTLSESYSNAKTTIGV